MRNFTVVVEESAKKTGAKKSEVNTVAKGVLEILEAFPETRNDDKLLMSTYWMLIDNVDTSSAEAFLDDFHSKAASPESIRRARQAIQESGFFLPTNPLVAARRGRPVAKEAEYSRGKVMVM